MKHFRPYEPEQMLLLPPSLRDWVGRHHEIYSISDIVDRMDLSAVLAAYEEPRGSPPYSPRMMVKILFYAYARGVRSSRKIERMLWEDVPMRVLSGNQQPDFWTIAAFRRRHLKALGELFVQTVEMAKQAGMAKVEHVALDGTKVKANASKHGAMSYGRMGKERDRLRAEVERYLKEAERTDTQEDKELGDRREWELPPHLATAEKRAEAIERAKAALAAQAREEQQRKDQERDKGGKGPGGGQASKPAVPKDKAQYNFTDPESRIMRTSTKSFEQAYNAQAVVDARSQIIVAADLSNQAADSPHLVGIVDQVVANLGEAPRQVSTDAGYFSEHKMRALADHGIEAFTPPEKVRHSQWREAAPLRGRPPKNLDSRGRMRRKLRTRRGRACYKLRQQTVEPVFGQIKWNRGLHQLLLRGLAAAKASWRFECAVHNVLKLRTAGISPA
jgi:transposase